MSERATFVMTKSIEQQTLDVLLRIEQLLLSRQAMTYAPNPYGAPNVPGAAVQSPTPIFPPFAGVKTDKPKGKHK